MRRSRTLANLVLSALIAGVFVNTASGAAAALDGDLEQCEVETLQPSELASTERDVCSLENSSVVLSPDLEMAIPSVGTTVIYQESGVIGATVRYAEVTNDGAEGVTAELSVDKGGDGAYDSTQVWSPDMNGALVAPRVSDETAETFGDVNALASTKCTSSSYALMHKSWPTDTMVWSYNPSGLTTALLPGVQHGAFVLAEGVNGCGLAQSGISAAATYQGTTSRAANIYGDTRGCATTDGYNTVSWGGLPTNTLALTCVWVAASSSTTIRSADIAFNSNYLWHAGQDACPSSSYYRLNEISAHEFGHAFGLGHSGGEQVMRPAFDKCSPTARLGKGDYLGMKSMYP
jgi:hypothetical protein